jgi:Flp pilus assembly pilin Flp
VGPDAPVSAPAPGLEETVMITRRIDPRSSRGASAVEYALLLSGLAAVIVLAVFTVGRVAGDQIAKGGACLTSSTCTAAAAPVATPSASASAAAAPVATPTPSTTASSSSNNGSGNNGTNGSGSDGGGNNDGKNKKKKDD